MNSSLSGQTVSAVVIYRESFHTAVAKNVLVVALGITINYINGTLIHTFRKHQVFYVNPRYILFIHLVVNDMIQLTTAICLFVTRYVFYKINTPICCIIISFAVFTTLNTPLNLAVMAVECYIAVCFPFRHAELCTIKKIYILIACIWALSILSFLPELFYFVATNHAQLFFSTIVCEISSVFPNPILIKKKDGLYILYLVGVWLVLIYTYFQIFFAARSNRSSDKTTSKARNTILLHSFQLLLCMLTFVYPMVVQILFNQFHGSNLMHQVFLWYVLVHIFPRLVSPIVYGLRDTLFRHHLKKHLQCATCVS